jgi:pyridoxal phosphate enzyme (YggS family)
MNELIKNLEQIKNNIPAHTTIVAVSKFQPIERIQTLYDYGHRDFGENYVQELNNKYQQLPKDIRWHFIGHLQSNKVKYIAPFIHLIHGVDSFHLLKEINKQAIKNNRTIHCLLQIHIAQEETKFGLSREELFQILSSEELKHLHNIKIVGLMGMATNTNDEHQIRKEFSQLKEIFDIVKKDIKCPNLDMQILSMGMSNDYHIAIQCGSNMIRLGTIIFGERISPEKK